MREDFRVMLASKGNTPEYVAKAVSQFRSVVEGTGTKWLHDRRGDAVLRFLAGRREVSTLAAEELAQGGAGPGPPQHHQSHPVPSA
jgi:hypothetical protein